MTPSNSRKRDGLGAKLRLVTQNFNGLKTDDQLDIITNTMETRGIDILVAQETWRHGKEKETESIVVNDTQIFLHGTQFFPFPFQTITKHTTKHTLTQTHNNIHHQPSST